MDATISIPATKPALRVEPIFIDVPGDWVAFIKHINTSVLKSPVNVKLSGEFIKVPPATIDDYRALTNYLMEKKIPFHALQPRAERPVKILIKGLKTNTTSAQVASALIAYGVSPIHVTCLKKRSEDKLLPLFMVTLRPEPGWEKVYELDNIYYMNVIIKPFKSKGIKQCYRCQGFGHSSQTCYVGPKCLKCGEKHHTRDCIKPRDVAATCANCRGPHPANYSGCPSNPKNQPKKPGNKNNLNNRNGNQGRQVIDAPLPAVSAWATRSEAVFSPLPAVPSSFPPLPKRDAQRQSPEAVPATAISTSTPIDPPPPTPAEKRAAAAAASRTKTERLNNQHNSLLGQYDTSSSSGIGEAFMLIKNIINIINLPFLISMLRECATRLQTAANPLDQIQILMGYLAILTTNIQPLTNTQH